MDGTKFVCIPLELHTFECKHFSGPLPFMPQSTALGMQSYYYPHVVSSVPYLSEVVRCYFWSQNPTSESATMGQLAACLDKLMGEVKEIKSDLKKVKKRKLHSAVSYITMTR